MLNIIVAISKNNCIGKDNKLPWHLPEDLLHFKKITSGKKVLMGRKTFESIFNYLGKPLPNRTSIIITRDKNYNAPEGVLVYTDLDQALDENKNDEVFVIGGATIYKQTIDKADRLYITHVDKQVDGDAFFPEINPSIWQEEERENHDGFSFVTFRRVSSRA